MHRAIIYTLLLSLLAGCQKKSTTPSTELPASFNFNFLKVNGKLSNADYRGANTLPEIKISFSAALNSSSVGGAFSLVDINTSPIQLSVSYESHDSTIVIKPVSPLAYISKYTLTVSTALKSKEGGSLLSAFTLDLTTAIDSSNKFPVITDDSLLTMVQKQTFRYFWNFAHPVSGMARERNSSGEVVTSGGTGFGIMAIPVAIERKFINRNEGVARLQTIVDFLKNKAGHFHGAFSHWMNGTSGAVVPFGNNDNGADIVETSYLMMGLLTARQYFNGTGTEEIKLRDDINAIWNSIEWDWFRKDGENMLYWNWSPDYGWAVNVGVRGWNECLITYVLAASSPTHTIPKIVYENGFAANGGIKNNNSYFGILLPLGQAFGGPLFFEQYSFLGINPTNLSDAYANYHIQTVNHSLINYEYCKTNPKNYFGYSNLCWGLTASDIKGGYTASSPTNDLGVIAPTAAVSSIPFTPVESLQTLKFFYYKMGDKLWGQYGFVDAFNLHNIWFADSYIAIDQGPQIGMIENYRTGLLWDLFMSCPEVQVGLTKLGFNY
jgi:hypothetical protein